MAVERLLSRLSGIACGRFSWDEEDVPPGDFSMEEILEERLGSLGIPVVLNLPVGHGLPNQALPLGAMPGSTAERAPELLS